MDKVTESVHYVGEKVNKIRWRPDVFGHAHFFVTGSWDNIGNTIKLWDFQEREDDMDIFPYLVNSFPIEGDVTEIQVTFSNYLNGFIFNTSLLVYKCRLFCLFIILRILISVENKYR